MKWQEKCEQQKLEARRDDRDKNLQSHAGLSSQSIPTETEIQLLLFIYLHALSCIHISLQ